MNILICGLGAIGTIYADKFLRTNCNLKILVDKKRYQKYKENPTFFNGKKLDLDYILPANTNFKADMIIIATKYDGFKNVVNNIENFVTPNTIIISLLNGLTSEKLLAEKYNTENILTAFFIGHSTERTGRKITHDGINTIVFGSEIPHNKNIEIAKNIFKMANIEYKIPKDITYSLWEKFMINVCANQTSAIFKNTFGEMYENKQAMVLINHLANEVEQVAHACNVKNYQKMKREVINFIKNMPYDNKTSMLQDVLNGRKPETNIFSGVVIELAKQFKIPVPYNEMVKNILSM